MDLIQDPTVKTYTVRDDNRVIAEHLDAAEVVDLMSEIGGHASISDDADGSLVVADTDGEPETIAALGSLLEDYETRRGSEGAS